MLMFLDHYLPPFTDPHSARSRVVRVKTKTHDYWQVSAEIGQWLEEHGVEYNWKSLRWDSSKQAWFLNIDIEDPDTALLFKLTWGGA